MDKPIKTKKQRPHLKIGGMALENGVLFQTGSYWAMAARNSQGEILIGSGEKADWSRSPLLKRLPLLRGLAGLVEAVSVLPQVRARGGRLPIPLSSPPVLASTLISISGAIALKNPKRRLAPWLEELLISAFSLLPSLVALRKTSATQYHAVEHKSINAYESSGGLDAEATRDAEAEHARCGSNIIGPTITLMMLGNTVARRALGRQSNLARMGVSLLSLSGALELVQWSARHPQNLLAKTLVKPGHELQNLLTTREPTTEQLDVGFAALRELLRREGALPAPSEAPS